MVDAKQVNSEQSLKKSELALRMAAMGMPYHRKMQELRKLKDWSVRQLAQHADVDPATARRLLRDLPDTVQFVRRLALALDAPLDWLLDDDLDWPPPRPALVPADFENPLVVNALLRAIGGAILRASQGPGGLK